MLLWWGSTGRGKLRTVHGLSIAFLARVERPELFFRHRSKKREETLAGLLSIMPSLDTNLGSARHSCRVSEEGVDLILCRHRLREDTDLRSLVQDLCQSTNHPATRQPELREAPAKTASQFLHMHVALQSTGDVR